MIDTARMESLLRIARDLDVARVALVGDTCWWLRKSADKWSTQHMGVDSLVRRVLANGITGGRKLASGHEYLRCQEVASGHPKGRSTAKEPRSGLTRGGLLTPVPTSCGSGPPLFTTYPRINAAANNTAQLKAVDAGLPFRLLQKAGMATARMQDMARRLEASGSNDAWSLMLDLYPLRFRDLAAMRGGPVRDRSREWYFDARSHVRLQGSQRPQRRHAGSRARLMHRFGVHRGSRLRRWRDPRSWIALFHGLAAIPWYNEVLKVMLFRLPAGGWFRTVHDPAFPVRADCLLAFEHYKFCGDLFRRLLDAMATGAYTNDTVRYLDLHRLLGAMARKDASFLCPYSEPAGAFAAYVACGAGRAHAALSRHAAPPCPGAETS